MGMLMSALLHVTLAMGICEGTTIADDNTRIAVPPLPSPGLRLYVSPTGADTNPGTKSKPFATLERARDEIRAVRQRAALPKGGVQVIVGAGSYAVTKTFTLGPADSGTSDAPIVYRAARGQKPVFSGGIRLSDFAPVTDKAVLARIPEEARVHVVQVDLKPFGVKDLGPLVLGGCASGNGFTTHPLPELFFDGEALPMARYPNKGVLHVEDICVDDGHTIIGMHGSKVGRIKYDGDRPARWKDEKDALLYGYWFFDWADSYERIVSIDTEKHEIEFAQPYHSYGYRKGARYYAINLLAELDAPGEWYLDRENAVVYLYPPVSSPVLPKPGITAPRTGPGFGKTGPLLKKGVVELSFFSPHMLDMDNVSNVRFDGLTWELGSGDAIRVKGGEHCLFAGCTVRRFGGNGIEINGGAHHGILSCDIYSMGRGGTLITGGDRKTLTPGGHFVVNCDIHHLSRIDHTYTPAVLMNGVGNLIAHNRMHHINSSALRIEGNDHQIAFNEVHDVLLESDDQGGADMFGNATYRGNVYRCNYWHHIGNWRHAGENLPCGQAGIRLDDAISGTIIEGNIFYRCASGKLGFGGIQIHGGKDNVIENNVFAACEAAISFSPWDTERWKAFVGNALTDPKIDAALYQERYPQLRTLTENPNVNTIQRNIVWKCGQFLLRDKGCNLLADNLVTDKDACFKDANAGNFRMGPAAPTPQGFQPIPFDKIGLYKDAFRRAIQ